MTPISHFMPPAHARHLPAAADRTAHSAMTADNRFFVAADGRFFIRRLYMKGRFVRHSYDAYLSPASDPDNPRFIANLRLHRTSTGLDYVVSRQSGRQNLQPGDVLPGRGAGNAMDGMLALLHHAASIADDAARRSIEEAAVCETENHRAWRRLFSEGTFLPFAEDEVLQILARSGSGQDAAVIARIAHSNHISRLPSGPMPEHLYVLRASRLADYARGNHDLPLIIQTPGGWSVGAERDFSSPRQERFCGGQIRTTWHKTLGQALNRTFSFYTDDDDSGHLRVANRDLFRSVGARARGARTLPDLFPDMNAKLVGLCGLCPSLAAKKVIEPV